MRAGTILEFITISVLAWVLLTSFAVSGCGPGSGSGCNAGTVSGNPVNGTAGGAIGIQGNGFASNKNYEIVLEGSGGNTIAIPLTVSAGDLIGTIPAGTPAGDYTGTVSTTSPSGNCPIGHMSVTIG